MEGVMRGMLIKTHFWDNLQKVRGYFVNIEIIIGKPNGKGIYTWNNGEIYDG